MPKHVRNFYITVETEDSHGRSKIGTGPVGKGGIFSAVVDVRHRGKVYHGAVSVAGALTLDGKLVLRVATREDGVIWEKEFER